MHLVILLCFLLLAAGLIYAFLLFDRLVRALHRQHHALWIDAGRPSGFFWFPRDRRFLTSSVAQQRLLFSLLRHRPTWVNASPDLTATLHRFRVTIVTWNLATLLLFFPLVIFAGWPRLYARLPPPAIENSLAPQKISQFSRNKISRVMV